MRRKEVAGERPKSAFGKPSKMISPVILAVDADAAIVEICSQRIFLAAGLKL